MRDIIPVTDPKIGEMLRVHPASDWFMKGEKYCRVLAWKPGLPSCKVQGTLSGMEWHEHLINLYR